ncbi:MAG: DUF5050 domain-containing protein [Oscillospiraceae bacterium]|jgi:hypothetical protein|nr:DUF5050 domain-containing protein [Oscillospiraceae bacterium]
MKCRRCGAHINEGKKMCPNCGVLVKKKAGPKKLAASSGVKINPFVEFLGDIIHNSLVYITSGPKAVLTVLSVPLVIVLIILFFTTDMLGSCAGSCANSCSGCSSSCSSCGGGEEAAPEAVPALNSQKPSYQFYTDGGLCYIKDDTLILIQNDGMSRTLLTIPDMCELQAYGEYIYFRSKNELFKVSTVTPITLPGSDPPPAVALPIVSISEEEQETLDSYFLANGAVYYCRLTAGDEKSLVKINEDGTESVIMSGKFDNVSYRNQRIYYCRPHTDESKNESEDSAYLYSRKLDGSDERIVIDGQEMHNYSIGGGYLYYSGVQKNENGGEKLFMCRYSLSEGKLVKMWAAEGLVSYMANDSYLYYMIRTAQGDSLYRVGHETIDAENIFYSDKPTELSGVSGDWFGLYVNVTAGGEPYAQAAYHLINSETGSIIDIKAAPAPPKTASTKKKQK